MHACLRMASRSLKRLPALPAEADVAEVVCAGGVTVDVNNGVGSGVVVDIPPLDIPDDGEGRFDLSEVRLSINNTPLLLTSL